MQHLTPRILSLFVIVVVYNVELDEIFVISNVTVTIVPIIPYDNIVTVTLEITNRVRINVA
jgi:hypothetical protein